MRALLLYNVLTQHLNTQVNSMQTDVCCMCPTCAPTVSGERWSCPSGAPGPCWSLTACSGSPGCGWRASRSGLARASWSPPAHGPWKRRGEHSRRQWCFWKNRTQMPASHTKIMSSSFHYTWWKRLFISLFFLSLNASPIKIQIQMITGDKTEFGLWAFCRFVDVFILQVASWFYRMNGLDCGFHRDGWNGRPCPRWDAFTLAGSIMLDILWSALCSYALIQSHCFWLTSRWTPTKTHRHAHGHAHTPPCAHAHPHMHTHGQPLLENNK